MCIFLFGYKPVTRHTWNQFFLNYPVHLNMLCEVVECRPRRSQPRYTNHRVVCFIFVLRIQTTSVSQSNACVGRSHVTVAGIQFQLFLSSFYFRFLTDKAPSASLASICFRRARSFPRRCFRSMHSTSSRFRRSRSSSMVTSLRSVDFSSSLI